MFVIKQKEKQTTTGEPKPKLEEGYLPVFEELGFVVHDKTNSDRGLQIYGSCIFCGSETKFYIQPDSGQWSCKKCTEQGNVYSFLTKAFIHYREIYPLEGDEMVRLLASNRELSVEAILDTGMFYDGEKYRFPVRNQKGSMVNFRSFEYPASPIKIKALPVLKLSLLGAHEITDKTRRVFICEGEWDRIATRAFLTLYGFGEELSSGEWVVLAAPGAGTWKTDWNKLLENLDVCLLYDNDIPGQKGLRRALDSLGVGNKFQKRRLEYLRWPTGLPEGFDMRDFHRSGGDYDTFAEMIKEAEPPQPIKKVVSLPKIVNGDIPSFKETLETYSRWIKLTPEHVNVLKITYAVVLSNFIKGDPLWIHVVASPSCLTGDTEVHINHKRHGKKYTLKNLVEALSETSNGKRRHLVLGDVGIQSVVGSCTRSLKIKNAWSAGVKQVFELKTTSGKTITGTGCHRFLTPDGYKRMRTLKKGDLVVVRNDKRGGPHKPKKQYRYIEGCKYHPYNFTDASHPNRIIYHRAVFEAHQNNMPFDLFVDAVRNNKELAGSLVYLDPAVDVHHKDGNNTNDSIDNLEPLSKRDHMKLENKTQSLFLNGAYYTHTEVVESITFIGDEETYDVEVEMPNGEEPNFVANRFVVHNSGKTEILMSVADCSQVVTASNITPHGLISGFSNHGGKDPSLLPALIDNIFILKDFTEVLQMPKTSKDEVYAILRGAYDGEVYRKFGNGIVREYYGHFSMLAGVTVAIDGESDSTMGERFLKYRMKDQNAKSRREVIREALSNVGHEDQMRMELREAAVRFLDRPVDAFSAPEIPDQYIETIVTQAELLCHLRAHVERDYSRRERILYKPGIEMGPRIAKQLKKLLIGLSQLNDPPGVTKADLQLVARVAAHSCIPFNLIVVMNLLKNPGQSIEDVAEQINIPVSTIKEHFDNMHLLGILKKERSRKAGRLVGSTGVNAWYVSDEIEELWRGSELPL